MNKSESAKEIFTALAAAQSEFPPIPRSRTVTVTGQRGSYKFSYAPFEDILRHVKPVLAKHGLGYTQGAAGEKLVTVVTHQSGEWFSHETDILNLGGTAQSYGSALTYARRYGFCGAYGIQADDDDDANAADGNTITETRNGHQGPYKATIQPGLNALTEMKEAALESLSPGERETARRTAADIEALVEEGRPDEARDLYNEHLSGVRAYDAKNKTDKAMGMELAFSAILGPKARSALKSKPVARA